MGLDTACSFRPSRSGHTASAGAPPHLLVVLSCEEHPVWVQMKAHAHRQVHPLWEPGASQAKRMGFGGIRAASARWPGSGGGDLCMCWWLHSPEPGFPAPPGVRDACSLIKHSFPAYVNQGWFSLLPQRVLANTHVVLSIL